jgi:hypothetical protein
MKNLRTVLLTVTVALVIGCKEKEVLPSNTEEGLNTFGVKIDGKIWLPVTRLSVTGGGEKIRGGYTGGVFAIVAKKGVTDEIITLVVRNVKSTGIYALNANSADGIDPTNFRGKYIDDDYFLKAGGVNEINITKFDTINKIASGTFKCQFQGKNKQITKNFTQGIFDVKL